MVSVLENGANEVTINIRSGNTYSIEGSLGARLKKVGLELGGSHESTGIASLHIRAQFPPPPKKGWL